MVRRLRNVICGGRYFWAGCRADTWRTVSVAFGMCLLLGCAGIAKNNVVHYSRDSDVVSSGESVRCFGVGGSGWPAVSVLKVSKWDLVKTGEDWLLVCESEPDIPVTVGGIAGVIAADVPVPANDGAILMVDSALRPGRSFYRVEFLQESNTRSERSVQWVPFNTSIRTP